MPSSKDNPVQLCPTSQSVELPKGSMKQVFSRKDLSERSEREGVAPASKGFGGRPKLL
jgi:hypothetical protein